MAYIVMTYIVMTYIVMAYIVTACTVMARQQFERLRSCFLLKNKLGPVGSRHSQICAMSHSGRTDLQLESERELGDGTRLTHVRPHICTLNPHNRRVSTAAVYRQPGRQSINTLQCSMLAACKTVYQCHARQSINIMKDSLLIVCKTVC